MSVSPHPSDRDGTDELLARLRKLPSEELAAAISEVNSYLASEAGYRELGDRRALKAKFDRV